MPETYSAHESRIYYVEETAYGQTPTTPSMLSVPAESLRNVLRERWDMHGLPFL